MFTIQKSFHKNRNLIAIMLLVISFVQSVVIVISNSFDLGLSSLSGMSSFMSFVWLATVTIFPFFLVKQDLKALPKKITYKGWLIGLTVSFLLSSVSFIV